MRQSAKGGYNIRGNGRVIGMGKIRVLITYPIIVLKIERRYPIIVAVFELEMKI